MVTLWCTIGLIVSAVLVSILGAAFSIEGIGALFSGAFLAVSVMAGALEFSKFVLAAYLHQRWTRINFFLRTYLVSSVVILSLITSMGIFGFLSNAYQSASSALEAEELKLKALNIEKTRHEQEISRLNKSVDEIPATRITARLKLRSEVEPVVAEYNKKIGEVDEKIAASNLAILEVKQKVGPLIYISRLFKIDIDVVVKYLILLFVLIFDPLAICLVIASSEALASRRNPDTHTSVSSNLGSQSSDEVIQMRFTDEANPTDRASG